MPSGLICVKFVVTENYHIPISLNTKSCPEYCFSHIQYYEYPAFRAIRLKFNNSPFIL